MAQTASTPPRTPVREIAAGNSCDAVAARRMLGVSEGASPDDIRRAYRAHALRCHPDKIATTSSPADSTSPFHPAGPSSPFTFTELHAAYSTALKESEKVSEAVDATAAAMTSLERRWASDAEAGRRKAAEQWARMSGRRPPPSTAAIDPLQQRRQQARLTPRTTQTSRASTEAKRAPGPATAKQGPGAATSHTTTAAELPRASAPAAAAGSSSTAAALGPAGCASHCRAATLAEAADRQHQSLAKASRAACAPHSAAEALKGRCESTTSCCRRIDPPAVRHGVTTGNTNPMRPVLCRPLGGGSRFRAFGASGSEHNRAALDAGFIPQMVRPACAPGD
jgi:hypothetical protein